MVIMKERRSMAQSEGSTMEKIHTEIGRLAAQNEIMMRQQVEIFNQLRGIRDDVQATKSDQSALKEKLETEVLPDVKDYAKIKQRGIGILAAVGVVFTLIGHYAEKLIATILR